MTKTNYTPQQQQAISERHHNILVSASAGSGKTSVLVERVIQEILEGVDVDQLLIVTFTDAAAKGMRDRIAKALRQQIKNPAVNETTKKRLKRQINLLGVANISTLHAFCLSLIKRYYYLIDLDPQFRLLTDQAEQLLLRDEVFQDTAEQFYALNDPAFEQLVQNFSNDRGDQGLVDIVNDLDRFATATPDPQQWMQTLANHYEVGNHAITEFPIFTDELQPMLVSVIQQVENDLQTAIDLAVGDKFQKVVGVLKDELAQAQQLMTTVQTGVFDTIREQLLALNFARMTGPRDEELKPIYTNIKALRDSSKASLQDLQNYFSLPEQQTLTVMAEAQAVIQELVTFTSAYQEAYQAEKRRRHVLDFSDLEHFALAILNNQSEDGQAVLAHLQQQYREVMVDEYQDTNQLQESILQKIVQLDPGNMFMVGDVKQSIYQFRQADPRLFLHKYQTYRQAQNTDGQAIILAENFRSMKNVTAFTNLIFEQLMDKKVGEMAYDEAAHLQYGATDYPSEDNFPAEILLYEGQTDDDLDAENLTFDVADKNAGEVQMVGQRILQMVQNQELIYDRQTGEHRPVEYGDITILAPTRNNNNLIVDQFGRLNIPVTVSDAQNYFQATEVRIMMALLKVIDNPYQDIPLVAVLRSPMVGLDENQLAYLRIQDKTDDYYQALKQFQTSPQLAEGDTFGQTVFSKIDHFLQQLKAFQTLATQNQLVNLIWTIYEETGFLDYVGGMPGGQQRQANLHALYQRAYDYEQSSFKGLFQFVRFIEQMQQQDQDLGQAPIQQDNNTVSVMTIHGSKGLEFPVVFLMNATHAFNLTQLRQDYLLDAHDGLGITYLNRDRIKIPTLPKQVLINTVDQKIKAEQMRLLYVALTRAEQRLIITGAYPDRQRAIAKWEKAFQSEHLTLPDQVRLTTNNFMDWIGMSLIRHHQFEQTDLSDGVYSTVLQGDETKFDMSWVTPEDLAGNQAAQDETVMNTKEILTANTDELPANVKQAIQQILTFNYQHVAATKTTAYQSVSEIKRLFEDPDNTQLGQLTFAPDAKQTGRYLNQEFAQPQFLQEEVALSPTAIGTATHLVLQMIDVTTQPDVQQINQTIARLAAAKLISPAIAERINVEDVLAFFETTLGQSILANPTQWHREVPFSMLLNGNQLFKEIETDQEKVLIHGIIDGYLETGQEIQLVDYKTDRITAQNDVNQVISKYRGQVNLYTQALQKMTNHKVGHKYLYLMAIKRLVELD